MSWQKTEKILRPDPSAIHMGKMKVDGSKCVKCGTCMANCPFRAWEIGPENYPVMKENYECFSCFNCKVACPKNAIIIVDTYHVDSGFWKTIPHHLPVKEPLEPRDKDGYPSKWTEVEETIFKRRTVRNFRYRHVPEPIIQRIVEAGRFGPSAGNCQPWKFIVITNRKLINELGKEIAEWLTGIYDSYMDDEKVKLLAGFVDGVPPARPGTADPRMIIGGMGSVSREGPDAISLGAPALILILGDDRAIAGADLNVGICAQNMNLVAESLGVGVCWSGFIANALNNLKQLKRKLGIKPKWRCVTGLLIGYPRFRQNGIVPREFRPITWFKEGSEEPIIQE